MHNTDHECKPLPDVTMNLINQFLELEGNLMRLKLQYKANCAAAAADRGGRSNRDSRDGRDGRNDLGGRRGGFDFNPRTGQGRILAILKLQPSIEQKELGYLLDMSRQALAELLAKLERSEFITREQSEKDRRSYIVQLTEKGRNLADKLSDGEADASDDPLGLAAALNALTPDEQQQLSEYLERISAAIRNRLGAAGDPRDDFAQFFREKFFSRHGFDRRDFARFGFDRAGAFNFNGHSGGGFDPRNGFDGYDPRRRNDGRHDPRNEGQRDPRNEGRNSGRSHH